MSYIESSSSGSAQATPAEASADTTATGAVAEPQDGACAPGTLHDFVSSLINDEAAKAAYLANPMAALGAAGLGDLSPADVQDALPHVADALPTDLAGLPGLGDLPLDLPTGLPTGLPALGDLPGLGDLSLPTDGLSGLAGALPTGALPTDGLPLDSLSDMVPSGTLPSAGDLPIVGDLPVSLPTGLPSLGDLPLAGELPVDLNGLADALPTDGLPALDGLPSLGDLPVDLPQLPVLDTPLGDVTTVADSASGLFGIAADTDVVDSSSTALVGGLDEGATLASHSESVLGTVAGETHLGQEFGGAVAGVTPLLDFAGNAGGSTDGDLHLWGGSNTPFGHTAVHADGGPDGLAIAAVSPLGDLAANTDGDFTIQPADTADLLDVDHIGTTGDAVIGTVAHYVSTGSAALAAGVDSGSDGLGGYLTGTPLAPVADTLDTTTGAVSDGIHQGGDMVAGHLPSLDALPVDQLPQLPQLPDLPDVSSSDLPGVGDVTGHLPVSLPNVQLPDTSAVTDLVSHNPVTDAVHQSPVGGLVDGVSGHLPQVGDHLPVVGDLDLGL